MTDGRYLVAGSNAWTRRIFNERISQLPGEWRFIGGREELDEQEILSWRPDYAFFMHWSWKVAPALINGVECVCFHMTDVPYGRGGSPLQNLIVRGHRHTKLTALRMVEAFDAGPVYLKADLSLEGGAEEVYIRAAELAADMIGTMVTERPAPVEQVGEPILFRRRQPAESQIPAHASLQGLFDFIRMLDAEGYPPAFLEAGGFRFEFRRAARYEGRIEADVRITRVREGDT